MFSINHPIKSMRERAAREGTIIDRSKIEGIEFKIADNVDELDQAFVLTGKRYKDRKYSDGNKVVSLYNAVRGSATFVAKFEGRVIGTMSFFVDGVGLPLDRIFKKEMDHFRKAGKRNIECGSFAIDRTFGNSAGMIPMMFNEMAIKFGLDLEIDHLFAGVHPDHKSFYSGVLCFEQFAEVQEHPYVGKAPVCPLVMKLKRLRENMRRVYGNGDYKTNVYNHIFGRCSTSHFSGMKPFHWDAGIFKYFKPDILRSMEKNGDPEVIRMEMDRYEKVASDFC